MEKSSKFTYILAILLTVALAAGWIIAPEKQFEQQLQRETAEQKTPDVTVNNYPTQDRVEYVLQCIEKHGGLRYETLYPCICKVDKLASLMTFDEYTQAKTFTFLRRTPGEKGGVFRDPPQAKELRKKLKETDQLAEDSCFVKM